MNVYDILDDRDIYDVLDDLDAYDVLDERVVYDVLDDRDVYDVPEVFWFEIFLNTIFSIAAFTYKLTFIFSYMDYPTIIFPNQDMILSC
jgi:hypothetical protein